MKRKNLKIWCLLLTVAMLLTMLPVAAFAANNVQKHLDNIEKIIEKSSPTISIKDANSKSGAEDLLEDDWWKDLKKEIKEELEDAEISYGSLDFHLEDFDKAVPKNRYDEDGEYGSAIVVVTLKGEMLGTTTLLIKPDAWGTADDEDDDDDYLQGDDDLAVKIYWKGDTAATRPGSVLVRLFANNKLFRSRSITGGKWYGGWEDVDDRKDWTVEVSEPDGYTCNIEKVKDDYFEVTMTKIGAASSDASSSTAVSGGSEVQKENPETGAAIGVFCCR